MARCFVILLGTDPATGLGGSLVTRNGKPYWIGIKTAGRVDTWVRLHARDPEQHQRAKTNRTLVERSYRDQTRQAEVAAKDVDRKALRIAAAARISGNF